MKKIHGLIKNLSLFIITSTVLLACQTTPLTEVKITEVAVSAPFDMPAIKRPVFDDCPNFLITDFGAVSEDQQKNTQAIAKAISAANEQGCGTVVIPKGEWITGKVHFQSNVNLHLQEGAVLLFSDTPEDYLPAVHTTWEGMECYNYSPLIYAYECSNVAITGKGELRAKMDVWRNWFSRPAPHMNNLARLYNLAAKNSPVEDRNMVNDTAHLRPQFIQFNRCQNVLIEGVKIRESPFWVIHPYMCKDVIIKNVNVYAHGHNNDGVDPEMSENVLIEDCFFDQGDDAIALKSGRNQDAWRLNSPSKNIVIKNCTVKNGHQLLAVGSELSGGIENVFMDNCEVLEGAHLYHLLFIKTNERRGGFVENIHFTNIKSGKIDNGIMGIETDVLYQWRDLVPTYERKLTPIQDIYLENVHAGNVEFIARVQGDAELPIQHIEFTKVVADSIRGNEAFITTNVEDFAHE